MWSEDDATPRRPDPLPKAVRRAHATARRPKVAQAFIAACAGGGALVALFLTLALTSGACAGTQVDCGAFSQLTLLYALFTIPIGIALGALFGGAQFDRATRAYRPEM